MKSKEIKISVSTIVKKDINFSIPRDILFDMLYMSGNKFNKMPKNAKMYIKVPSGGDWSGSEIDLDNEDMQLYVSWTENSNE